MITPDFTAKLNRLKNLYRKFPEGAGIEAEDFSNERFKRKNWVDKTNQPWDKAKTAPDWLPKKWRKKRGSLMVDSVQLKNSVRVIKTTRNSVTIGTDKPYAQIHNEGGTVKQNITIKAHSRKRKGHTENVKEHSRKREFKIPQRKFIGESAILMRRIERFVQREINEILK
jgi:phage gpG-like protein